MKGYISKIQLYKFIEKLKQEELIENKISYFNNINLYISMKRYFTNKSQIIMGKMILPDINESFPYFKIKVFFKNGQSSVLDYTYPDAYKDIFIQEPNPEFTITLAKSIKHIVDVIPPFT
jgi:hypothetical protein